MRVAPVSGDLLVKLALGVLAVGALVLFARRAAAAVPSLSSMADAAGDALRKAGQAINPANPDNVVASTVNAGVSAIAGRETNLGGELHDLFNPDPMAAPAPAPAPVALDDWSTGGGRWNNPSAYQTPGVTGDGGAAFGIYPRP